MAVDLLTEKKRILKLRSTVADSKTTLVHAQLVNVLVSMLGLQIKIDYQHTTDVTSLHKVATYVGMVVE